MKIKREYAAKDGWSRRKFELLQHSIFIFFLWAFPCYAISPYFSLSAGFSGGHQASPGFPVQSGEFGLEGKNLGMYVNVYRLNSETIDRNFLPGNITLIPVSLGINGKSRLKKRFSLRFGGGAGWFMADREIEPKRLARENIPNQKVTEEIEEGIGFHVGGGMEYRISRHFALQANFYQFFFQSKLIHTRKQMRLRGNAYIEEKPIDLSTVIGTIGMKYVF